MRVEVTGRCVASVKQSERCVELVTPHDQREASVAYALEHCGGKRSCHMSREWLECGETLRRHTKTWIWYQIDFVISASQNG